MSLGIMLRGFMDYAGLAPHGREQLVQRLTDQFGDAYHALSNVQQEALVAAQAAQAVQDIQEEIWCREINIDKLIPPKDTSLHREAGILQNKAITDIAKKYFRNMPNPANRQVLADRVLFGATLSNLVPMCYNAKDRFATRPEKFKGKYDDVLLSALNDGMVSYGHREIRVFDLLFKTLSPEELRQEPKRWCRYHTGPAMNGDLNVGNMYHKDCWSQIGATVIASGAFPFAFEPVVLTRYKNEFGNLWPKDLEQHKSYPFTYVDGGTFNNEPIREAFRLAAYIDSQDEDRFERRIIFVDPNVSEIDVEYHLPVHKKYAEKHSLNSKLTTYRIEEKQTRDKLIGKLTSVLNAFMHEARTIEGDKVLNTRQKFWLRRELRNALQGTKDEEVSPEALHRIVTRDLEELIGYDRENEMLPLSRHSLRELLVRLRRHQAFAGLITPQAVDAFLQQVRAQQPVPHSGWWYSALMYLYLDFAMGLYGKSEDTYLLPIGPYKFQNDNDLQQHEGEVWDLPGGGLEGFAGFASEEASNFEVKFARYCAVQYMKRLGLIPATANTGAATQAPIRVTFQQIKEKQEFRQRIKGLYKRLVSITANEGSFMGLSLKFLIFMNKIIQTIGEDYKGEAYEMRIKVPSGKFLLDSKHFIDIGDQEPFCIGQHHYLITFAFFDEQTGKWDGYYINNNKLPIHMDRNFWGDKSFCEIMLPDREKVKELRCLPDPVLFYEVKESDEGHNNLPATDWVANLPGVQPLEQVLL